MQFGSKLSKKHFFHLSVSAEIVIKDSAINTYNSDIKKLSFTKKTIKTNTMVKE